MLDGQRFWGRGAPPPLCVECMEASFFLYQAVRLADPMGLRPFRSFFLKVPPLPFLLQPLVRIGAIGGSVTAPVESVGTFPPFLFGLVGGGVSGKEKPPPPGVIRKVSFFFKSVAKKNKSRARRVFSDDCCSPFPPPREEFVFLFFPFYRPPYVSHRSFFLFLMCWLFFSSPWRGATWSHWGPVGVAKEKIFSFFPPPFVSNGRLGIR